MIRHDLKTAWQSCQTPLDGLDSARNKTHRNFYSSAIRKGLATLKKALFEKPWPGKNPWEERKTFSKIYTHEEPEALLIIPSGHPEETYHVIFETPWDSGYELMTKDAIEAQFGLTL